jgi:S1-C subfamily serine protease
MERKSIRRDVLTAMVAATIGSITTCLLVTNPSPETTSWGQESTPSAAPDYLGDEELRNVAVYEQGNRSVVHITTLTLRQEFIFEVPTKGSGSGSVIDQQGHILTNFHVIEDASNIQVTLFNGKEFPAKLVGKDDLNDIAVLQIDAAVKDLFPVPYESVPGLKVGQKVLAIGNPFGLERTMTVGVVSSLNRTLPSRQHRTMKSMIQIDAALNAGNSGGPLLNSRGRLIGMNTAIASTTGQNTGVGFAIPLSTIKRIVPQLIADGRVVRPSTGIRLMVNSNRGPVIVATETDGAADNAGLQGFRILRRRLERNGVIYEERREDRDNADVIEKINGVVVTTVDDFLTQVEQRKPGDEVILNVWRNGKRRQVRLRLGGVAD